MTMRLPPDVYWPLRVQVPQDGQCVPFHLMWAWYWQFFVRTPEEVNA